MNKKLQRKFNIVILIATILFGVYGTNMLLYKNKSDSKEYMRLLSNQKCAEVEYEIININENVDLLAEYIYEKVTSIDVLEDEDRRKELNRYLEDLSIYALKGMKVPGTIYTRWAPEVVRNGIDGFFLQQVDGKIERLEITNLLEYNPSDVSRVGWYYIPIQTGAPVWLDPYMNLNNDMKMISYVIPIYLDNKPVGVVGMDIQLDSIIKKVEELEIYKTGFARLLDVNGKVLCNEDKSTKGLMKISRLLCNNMELVIYASDSEVYREVYKPIVIALLIIYSVLLVVFLVVTYINKRELYRVRQTGKIRRIRRRILVAGVMAVIVVQVVFSAYKIGILTPSHKVTPAKNTYTTTYKVVGDIDFAPFSYVDDDNNYKGYDVELINEIANRNNFNIEIELMNWREAIDMMENKEADIILGYSDFTSDKDDNIIGSIVSCYDTCVLYGREKIDSLSELLDKRIAKVDGVVQSDVYGLAQNAESYPRYKEAVKSVEEGVNDYVIIRKSVAECMIEELGYTDLVQVYDLINGDISVGVRKDKKDLLKIINSTLEDMKKDGTIGELKNNWLESTDTSKNIAFVISENRGFFAGTYVIILALTVILFFDFYFSKKRELTEKSETDALTKILNRGGGERRIRMLLDKNISGMFCLMDVDKFKGINDTYGHATGDKVLYEIASCLCRAFRDRDIIMRLGGDEFAVYAVGVTDIEEGGRILNRLFTYVNGIDIDGVEKETVSLSVGVSIKKPEDNHTFEELYKIADKQTYVSKKSNGNKYNFG